MKSIKNMEVIEDKLSTKQFGVAGIGNNHGYELKKIYLNQEIPAQAWVRKLFPGAQIVRDIQEITSDNCIELVIISASNSNDISTLIEVLQTGKHVRII